MEEKYFWVKRTWLLLLRRFTSCSLSSSSSSVSSSFFMHCKYIYFVFFCSFWSIVECSQTFLFNLLLKWSAAMAARRTIALALKQVQLVSESTALISNLFLLFLLSYLWDFYRVDSVRGDGGGAVVATCTNIYLSFVHFIFFVSRFNLFVFETSRFWNFFLVENRKRYFFFFFWNA